MSELGPATHKAEYRPPVHYSKWKDEMGSQSDKSQKNTASKLTPGTINKTMPSLLWLLATEQTEQASNSNNEHRQDQPPPTKEFTTNNKIC